MMESKKCKTFRNSDILSVSKSDLEKIKIGAKAYLDNNKFSPYPLQFAFFGTNILRGSDGEERAKRLNALLGSVKTDDGSLLVLYSVTRVNEYPLHLQKYIFAALDGKTEFNGSVVNEYGSDGIYRKVILSVKEKINATLSSYEDKERQTIFDKILKVSSYIQNYLNGNLCRYWSPNVDLEKRKSNENDALQELTTLVSSVSFEEYLNNQSTASSAIAVIASRQKQIDKSNNEYAEIEAECAYMSLYSGTLVGRI